MTVRDIRAHLREMYQVDVSPDLISRVTDAVAEELAEWQARPLDPVWPVVFIDALVRHEAPCIRVEVEDLRRRVVAAA
jgi:putative transposase